MRRYAHVCERAAPLALPVPLVSLRAGSAPRAPHKLCNHLTRKSRICERALPLALSAGGVARLQTPTFDAWHTINPSAHASVMPNVASLAACSDLPVGMRTRRLACGGIESGYPGAKPWAVGAASAAAPCRPPRRRIASCRCAAEVSNRAPRGAAPGRGCRERGRSLPPAA
jgi:hypothetical protein